MGGDEPARPRCGRDRVKFALGIVVLLVVGVAVLAVVFQRRLVFPVAAIPPLGPVALDAQTVTVTAADGATLHALWHAPAPGMPVVVSFHGNGSRPEGAAWRFTHGVWQAQGWGVLAIAYHGYPGSTGSPSETTLMLDGEAAIAFAKAQAPGAPILLHGHSMGSGVAVPMAARHGEVIGLFLDAPYSSFLDVAQWHYPFVPAFLFFDRFDSAAVIGRVAAPIFIVHGTADSVVPYASGQRLAAAAPAGTRFETIPGGDHVDILGLRDAEAAAFFRPASAAGEVVRDR